MALPRALTAPHFLQLSPDPILIPDSVVEFEDTSYVELSLKDNRFQAQKSK